MEHPKVIKIGNSKGITIPHKICEKLSIKVGDFMDCTLTVKNEILIIKHAEKGTS